MYRFNGGCLTKTPAEPVEIAASGRARRSQNRVGRRNIYRGMTDCVIIGVHPQLTQ